MNLITDLLDLLYPSFCLVCEVKLVKGEEFICHTCLQELSYTQYMEMQEQPVSRSFHGRIDLQNAASWLHFDQQSASQQIIHKLKYGNRSDLGVFLGKRMGADLLKTNRFKHLDLILPIPISESRRRMRGYNQSACLAEGLSAILGVPYSDSHLKRAGKSKSQTKKGRQDRYFNVENAFRLGRELPESAEHVLLVDDVLTTGATLEACGKEILRHREVKLSCITLAFTD